MKRTDFLFILLRSALWGTPVEPFYIPPEKFRQLLELTDEQTVSGLMGQAVMDKRNRFKLKKYDTINIYSYCGYIAEQNKLINAELTALCRLLKKHGIAFFVVKGQTIAARMPQPGARMSGDIDFFCDAQNFEKAKSVITAEWDVEPVDDEESEQHIAFKHNGIHFELHFCLIKFASSSNQRYFDKLISQSTTCFVDIDGEEVPVPEPTVNLLYTFLHLYHHLLELGVGLRQFCDIAVLCHQQDADSQKLQDHLHALGFTRAFKAVGAILVDELGLPEGEFPLPLTQKDRKNKQRILGIVFKRGNFGLYGRKTKVRSGLLYYMESLYIKVAHYALFYRLSPREVRASLLHSIPQKIRFALFHTKVF